MEIIGLFSHHIVLEEQILFSHRLPVAGIILVSGEVIQQIVKFDEKPGFDEVVQQYPDVRIEDYTDNYISPGIIETNVRKEWDSYTDITKMGAAGGVTLLILDKSAYVENEEVNQELACDIGIIQVVNGGAENLQDLINSDCIGIKAYMYSPSSKIEGLKCPVQNLFQMLDNQNIPLIIDPSMPPERMLYMASPYKQLPLEDRLKLNFPAQDISAGAFADSLNPKDSDEEVDELGPDVPYRGSTQIDLRKSDFDSHEIIQRFSMDTMGTLHGIKKLDDILKQQAMDRAEDGRSIKARIVRRYSGHDLLSVLERQIKIQEGNITNLSLVEQSSYQYQEEQQDLIPPPLPHKRCSSTQMLKREIILEVPPQKQPLNLPKRPQNLRRPPLNLTITPPTPPPNKDTIYINYLANCPDKWEVNGIIRILEAAANYKVKIHIPNISSASSYIKLRQAKDLNLPITCETSANYLFFTDDMITQGQVQLKDFPPIRNKRNLNFLWDWLKLNYIDVIGSHHVSVAPLYKSIDNGDFKKNLSGINCLGFTLQSIWSRLNIPMTDKDVLEQYIVRLSYIFSANPAKIFNVYETRGSISEGKYADFIIWSPKQKFIAIQKYSNFSNLCVYNGLELFGQIKAVYLRGRISYTDDKFDYYGKVITRPVS